MKSSLSLKNLRNHSAWNSFLLVVVATLTLEATSLVQYYFSHQGLKKEASMRAEGQLESTKEKIMGVVGQAEAAVRNSLWIASWCLDYPDSLERIPQRIVEANPVVVGSTFALVPDYDRKNPLVAPYVIQDPQTGALSTTTLATDEYDYPSKEWFVKPIELGEGYWSEPYVDVGGGNILMTTYSLPIRDRNGKIAGVLTADISLDWLTDLVGNLKVYPNAYSMVVSRTGQIMVSPVDSFVMQKNIMEVTSKMEDTAVFNGLGRQMLSGKTGNMPIRYSGGTKYIYFAPVERTGWSMSIVIPDEEIFGDIRKIGMLVKLLQILGILMLMLIIRLSTKNHHKFTALSANKEKMENELKIASDIQMAMVPKIFPPFPERKDIDMAAMIVPAREVGGDLYDFFIRDEKLFFCVGDVSGKGVPASLVMAVTRSLFRSVASHENSPGRIVSLMNASMAEMNESNMFVTFFLGILDLKTGSLGYCNAGHNPPLSLTNAIRKLPVEPNLPLGIVSDMQFKEQEIALDADDAIFLYTDGLTEAENINHEMFGEERVMKVLSGRKDAMAHLEKIRNAVAEFVGDAPQSDDMTILFIHYLGCEKPDVMIRNLVLDNNLEHIPVLAEFVEGITSGSNVDPGVAMGINLALEEAVTNVMMYAYPEGTKGQIEIEAKTKEGSMEFTISDSGKAFDPTSVPEPDINLGAAERKVGGLGIFMVRKIMDSVTYRREDGKNILSMIKTF